MRNVIINKILTFVENKSMKSCRKRILIVDDEEDLRSALGAYLDLEGYQVDSVCSAEDAFNQDIRQYDLILVDIMMDGMDGVEMVRRMKSDPMTSGIPVIFLTARDSEEDMVGGLNVGADDYISKPYSIRNLLARIAAVLRRSNIRKPGGVYCDRKSLICYVDDRMLKLPRKEFELLALFTENPGRIFTRDEILDKIWPEKTVIADRSIDVHVTRLRGKIIPYGNNIITRSGYGYGWQD